MYNWRTLRHDQGRIRKEEREYRSIVDLYRGAIDHIYRRLLWVKALRYGDGICMTFKISYHLFFMTVELVIEPGIHRRTNRHTERKKKNEKTKHIRFVQ